MCIIVVIMVSIFYRNGIVYMYTIIVLTNWNI